MRTSRGTHTKAEIYSPEETSAVPRRNSLSQSAERLGQLQLRYWSKFLDPKLVKLMVDVENNLRHIDMSISNFRSAIRIAKFTNASVFERSISTSYIQSLLNALVTSVDEKVFELQSLSIG